MATTKQELEQWFKRGLEQGATHMVVVCDTYDWEDYPVFVKPDEDARTIAGQYASKNMQKVMEVYDLRLDMAMQMAEPRANHY